MTQVGARNGIKVFSFEKTADYKSLQKEFDAVQQSYDIGMLSQFLSRNYYHHESLLYFADFFRMQGKLADAAVCLERALYAFETAMIFEFQPVVAKDQP